VKGSTAGALSYYLAVPGAELHDVRAYWEEHPVAAAAVPYEPGTPEFFASYDRLREENETLGFSYQLHEYRAFSGGRVLDVGCGNGYVLSKYAQEGAYAFGIDLTRAAVSLSRTRFDLSGLDGDFLVGSAEDLPYPSGTFDCVCSMGVLHHTPDTDRAVAEIHRVLRPGGRLVLMLYHRDSAVYWRFRLRSRMTGRPLQTLVNEVDGVGNPKGDVYSRAEMGTLLRDFDGVELSVGFLQGVAVGGRRFPPKSVLRPLESRFGWFLYAKARKPAAA
jgi:SAM-dependent methyltransferase